MTEIQIGEQNLAEATDYIHDLWFSLEDLLAQKGPDRTIALRISTSDPTPTALLTIKNVDSLRVRDTERIDCYDINYLRYRDGLLKVVTNIPLTLEFQVSGVNLVIQEL